MRYAEPIASAAATIPSRPHSLEVLTASVPTLAIADAFAPPSHESTQNLSHTIAGQRLSAQEVRRRLWHMTPGLLPIALWFIPHTDPWGWILWGVVATIILATVTTMILRFHKIARPQEAEGYSAVAAYAGVVLATLLLLPGREEVGMMTLAILAFGDGSATLFGLSFGGYSLPWNRRKSWTGLLAFIGMGALLGGVMLWGESRPGIALPLAITIGGLASLAAAFVESWPSKRNDNLRVGLTAATVGTCLHLMLVP
ncbi:MAG: hypothetical protein C0478_16840 [Planctomyces sp.]|nr:hypothetical protein [Planctomyces sp.]